MGRGLPILATLAGSLALTACGSGGAGSAAPATATLAHAISSPTPAAPTAPAAISIDAPAAGASVRVPFEISGSANVFEGALQVRTSSPRTM